MVSGGARGITAACLLALADRSQLKFVVLGRTALVEEPEFAAGCVTDAEIKQAIMAEYKRLDRKITLAEMASESRKILSCREIRSTLQGLEARGSQVKYFALDIRSADALNRIVREIHAEWGEIRMLIHAAGVIFDKYIHEKTITQFDDVFTTKVSGFRNLLSATRNDPLTRIFCFSSVVAQMGHAGQVDYAMANETLNKVCQFERRRRSGQCRVKALNWGPWDAGMVTPQHRLLFEAAGLSLIPVDDGARLFVKEMEDDGNNGPVEVIITGNPGNRRNEGPFGVKIENGFD
jgi:NAD(P)-dependent dehydrogenase (short-subunit alcohol dehydrogenase family)